MQPKTAKRRSAFRRANRTMPRRRIDIATEARLLEALRSLEGKLTMVVAAHRLSAVAECDQLIDLRNEPLQLAEAAK